MKDTISEGASIAFLCFIGYDLSFIVFLWIIEFNFCTKKNVKLLLFCMILKYNYGQLARQNYSVSYTGTQSKMERCLHPKEILILRSRFLRDGVGGDNSVSMLSVTLTKLLQPRRDSTKVS